MGVNGKRTIAIGVSYRRDLVLFQVNRGAGIGRYITDLNSEGGETASSTPPPTSSVCFLDGRLRQL